ncbi:hypothetical protein [Vibrio sp. Y29_XK_CS5]|nr:hypothetical protein [Vibrio sp. Y29_XK_CS5]
MELTDFLTTLNGMGLSPTLIALIAFLWRQDKRLTIVETILEQK